MRVIAEILEGPISESAVGQVLSRAKGTALGESTEETGARVRFEGIVRRTERNSDGGDSALVALDYEVYEPMASAQLLALAKRIGLAHDLQAIVTLHSRGRVPVGEVSFVLIIDSAHRREGLAAATEFIDDLKRDVPIWKRAVWA